ncbi:flagellar type III secretion system protein FlhB [Cognatiyoonia sp. IB215446]|uniref:EscU/YscU/HrcU family type III secretion system export apparatus switch protein n=1 Tax=Cognatiyoonia sp. IB215446 TaxID=3097355 RepID=UPI002A150C0C|nr:flagellar type III secretion system protein FlhB [Cognatiyoonia sp. IB215446]MDX8346413.1 flagellar type III secretion system protein FlhB [Cognatiyoonia sp. IB215446]
MSTPDEDSDKQFEPTQKKLDDARKKGEIAKSADITTAAAYAGFLIVCLTVGPASLIGLSTAMSVMLGRSYDIAVEVFDGPSNAFHAGILREVFWGTAAWFIVPASLAILAVMAQRAFVVTPSKLAPKLNRISPIESVKNKLGRQGLFEFTKSAAKLTIYSVIMAIFLIAQLDRIIVSIHLPPALIVNEIARMLVSMTMIVICVAFVIGGIDYLWQHTEHIRKNRMSRKEVIEELKQAEGDPMMKQQRRQKGQEIAMNKMLSDVPTADVVVVNPTHFAVALKWDRNVAPAPVCVAKGIDEIAARIREVASENAVPIHSDPPTARALHATVDLGEEIAPEHYQAVAAAIRFAEGIRQKARAR